MADNKNNKPVELDEEQLDEVNGGDGTMIEDPDTVRL